MKNVSLISLLLLGALLASCGGGNDTVTTEENNTDAVTGGETAAVTEDAYDYPELDCGGEPFRILNADNAWGTYGKLDFDEATGESLDDVIYERNRNMEERYNFVFAVNEDHDIDAATTHFSQMVMAGDDVYDAAYLRADTLPAPLTNGMLYDLSEIDGFRFDEPWWDSDVITGGRIGNDRALYFASNYFSLFGFDSTVCMYFNEQKFTDLDIEFPYQLVRDGKWTLDRMFEYVQQGMNLNGDTDFTWNAGGNATYGVSIWSNGYHALLIGSGATYADMDANGAPIISAAEQHFIDVTDKLTEHVFGVNGAIIRTEVTDGVEPFLNGRSMMAVAQVKSANAYRDMEDNFGLLPMPKYDEAQDGYSCYISSTQLLMTLPITSNNTERTAILMDALAYESYRDVLPVYYEQKVSQKGLRNDDSIEMLDIVRANRYTNFGEIFGWTNTLQHAVHGKVSAGSGDIASLIASNMKTIEKAIETTMEMVNE